MSTPAEKIESRIRAGKSLRGKTNGATPHDSLAFLRSYEMTDEEAEQITDAKYIEPGLIVEGHVVAIVAKPNGGKTTIMYHLACKWARTHTVVYIHADTNPGDAKLMLAIAKTYGVRYLTPDMKVGKSMRNVVEDMQRLATSDTDLSGHVWLFDTLKKMTNVINKDSLRQLLMLLRKLSSRGMTCILLAHTNKYRNADGEWQFEGTGDLEADTDELIYFEPQENPDGSLTVSTRCVKRRADIAAMTWDIHRDRTVVQRTEYVDVLANAKRQAQREKDSPVIEAISEALSDGAKKQTEVIEHCRQYRQTEKRVRAVLREYSGELWRAEKLFERNAWRYELCRTAAELAHPAPVPDCRTGRTDEHKPDL